MKKEITSDSIAKTLWEASTKCPATIQIQEEIKKSREEIPEEHRWVK